MKFREVLANENHSEDHKEEFHRKPIKQRCLERQLQGVPVNEVQAQSRTPHTDTFLLLFAFRNFGHPASAEGVAMQNRFAKIKHAFIASKVTRFNVEFCLPVEFVQAFFLGIARQS